MKAKRYLYTGLIAFSVITGCSNTAQPPEHADHDTHTHQSQPQKGEIASNQTLLPNGDLQEVTASITKLPAFLEKVDPQIKEIYRIAGDNQDVLKWVPCYCGCGDEAGHMHNGNCFIKEVKSDGSVVWDDHGTRCGTCMEIAFISAKMKKEGKTVKEIRTFIDGHYKDDYAKPTPTPMPT